MSWTRTSASQHEAFKRCQRYWYFGWIDRIKRPTTPAQQRGTDIHAEVEHYLKTGEIRDSSYTDQGLNYRPYVEALVPYLPRPGHPELIIEQRIEMPTGLGVNWLGFIDLAWEEQGLVFLRDTKSTSDFRYTKTPSELMGNIQLVSYAHWAFDVVGHDGPIDVGLTYVKTEKKVVRKKPKTKLVRVGKEEGFDRAHVEDVWLSEMETVAQMKVAALAESAHELPPTPSACGMFGGCPFGGRCGLTIGDMMPVRAKKTKGTEKMANRFLKKMKDKKSNGVPTGTLPPDAPARETPVADAETKGPPAEPPEEKPKKKGRPKGSTSKKKKAASSAGGMVLYIDCMPTKDTNGGIEPTLFEDWFGTLTQEMNEQVMEEKNLPSYLLLPYAEEKALVALTVQSAIEKLPQAMVVTSGTPGARDALGTLIPHATTVVRAMRG